MFYRISIRLTGLENIFPFLVAKSKNINFLCESNIKLVDFRERIVPHIVINLWYSFGIFTIIKLFAISVYKMTKMSCKV